MTKGNYDESTANGEFHYWKRGVVEKIAELEKDCKELYGQTAKQWTQIEVLKAKMVFVGVIASIIAGIAGSLFTALVIAGINNG